jgi:hypothetical protein
MASAKKRRNSLNLRQHGFNFQFFKGQPDEPVDGWATLGLADRLHQGHLVRRQVGLLY